MVKRSLTPEITLRRTNNTAQNSHTLQNCSLNHASIYKTFSYCCLCCCFYKSKVYIL